MNNFKKYLNQFYAACVRFCTRRFYNCFIYLFKIFHNIKRLLFSVCVRDCTRRLNKNLIYPSKIIHLRGKQFHATCCLRRFYKNVCYAVKTARRLPKQNFERFIWQKGYAGLILGLTIFLYSFQTMAAPTVSFSKNVIGMNETAELIFSSDEPITAAPDMNEVSHYFRVSGQQMQQLASVVNGQLTQSYQLVFNVRPLKVGKVTLNNLMLNGQKLNPVTLDVVEGAASFTGANAGSVKLQAVPDKKQVYEGDSFIYKLVLYDASQIIDGQLLPPRIPDADIRPLGQDKVYRGVKDGKTVEIVERSFLVTPKSAGTLTLDPAVFEGTSRESLKARRSPADLFDMGILFDGLANFGAPVSAHSDAVTVRVLQKPASWQGWWLPSSSVTLTQSFKMPDKIVVGQPIERTLTLRAAGVGGEKLPELAQPVSDGFKVYPSVPQRRTDESADGIAGYEELTVVLIPTKSGQLTIPSIEVPWFDIKTSQRQVAKVPARTLNVAPADAVQNTSVGGKTFDSNAVNGQDAVSLRQTVSNAGMQPNESIRAIENPQTASELGTQSKMPVQTSAIMPQATSDVREPALNRQKAAVNPQVSVSEGQISDSMPQTLPSAEQKTGVPAWLLILLGIVIGVATAGLIMYFYVRRQEAKKKKPLPDLYPF